MHEFKLPEIGEGVVEGEIVRWLKQPGEAVEANEALIEVMTDKATIEIPSPITGVIQELVSAEGDICAVGAVIAKISTDGAPAAAPAPAPAAAPAPAVVPAPAAAPAPSADDAKILATPAARALARDKGVALSSIPVDERGRVTKGDVLAHLESPAAAVTAAPAAAPAPSIAAPAAAAAAPAAAAAAAAPAAPSAPATARPAPAPVARPSISREDETIPFRGMRRVIAEQMARSYSTAVHYTYVEQIDVTKLVALRKELKPLAREQGISLSYLPFIVKACVAALKKYPIVNAVLDEENRQIVMKKRYHIGVAAATDQGLTVPVVRDADAISLLDIANEIARLADAAKSGTASRDDLSGSTFTISSLGNIGGVLATPIINYPEVGILGVHAIRKTPIFDENDNVVVGHLMNLSVSLDHRVVDGFEGASFLQEVRRLLEEPNLLMLTL